ncbi:MAG TPA: hypothetical protein DEB53_10405, partial [Bacillus pumilus]|nr:hypothetical protein [Bacillus pumilus]
GATGATGTGPFLSSGVVAAQANTSETVPAGGLVSFDLNGIIGNDITFNGTDTFTLQPGLYHVEYDVNTAENTGTSVFNLLQNGVSVTGVGNSATSGGNMGSGSIIIVPEGSTTTVSLQNNSTGSRTLSLVPGRVAGGTTIQGAAANIRFSRFADGPSV